MLKDVWNWLRRMFVGLFRRWRQDATVGTTEVWYDCPYLKARVELTYERREHITSRHPDVAPYLGHIGEALESPDEIRRSQRDPETLVFYRFYRRMLGGKNLAVAVKTNHRSFILTAYLTRTRVNGEIVWTRK